MPTTEQDSQDTLAPSLTIWDRSAAGRWFARIFSFELLMISTLLILPLILSQTFTQAKAFLRDPDIWWHLANARHLFASGFIHAEPYSFTVAGKPWINPEWIAEIPYWLGYSHWGLHGLFIVAAIAGCLNILGIYLLARLRTGHMWSSFVATFLVTPILFVNFGTRTILWGYVCLIIELAILEAWKQGHRRLIWLLPPLFCLWINTHGSWAIGAFIFMVFLACNHLSFSWGDFYTERLPIPDLTKLWLVALLCVAALWINPYGWKLIWNPFDMAFHQKLNIAVVEEWRALQLGTLVGKIVVLIALLLLLTNGLQRRKWHLMECTLLVFGFFAAIDHIRFCVMLAILAAPSLAWELHRTWLNGKNPNQKRPLLNTVFLLAFWAFALKQLPSTARLQQAYDQKFPTQIMREIQPGWRVMNSMNLGGWLAFHNKSDFIDTRYDTFDHHGVLKDFLLAMYINNTLQILNKYKIDHVLFEKGAPVVYLLMHSGGWKQIGEQNGFVLLARTSS